MRIKQITTEKQAVAGVIEALLLVALIAIIISIIQLQYIPQVMEQREADHMDQVANQFSSLKAMVDIQSVTGSLKSDAPLAYIPMNTQITLGSRQLPYFITMPSYGDLSIEENEAKISGQPSFLGPHSSGIVFSALVYHAYNCYFVEQSYVFEGGGIILNQSSGNSSMRADPSVFVKDVGDEINVKFYLPNITAVEGKDHTEGYGSCFIRTNYSASYNASYYPYNMSSDYIYIQSRYLDAWNTSLNRSFARFMTIRKGYVVDDHGQPIEVVKITPRYKKIQMDITVVDIRYQIGPGWVI